MDAHDFEQTDREALARFVPEPDTIPGTDRFFMALRDDCQAHALHELRRKAGRYVVEVETVDGDITYSETKWTRRGAFAVARSMRSPFYDVVIYRRGDEIERYPHTPPAVLLGRA